MLAIRAAKVAILDQDNNALVLRRSATHPRSPHHADLPGGIIEDGELFEAGLSREIKEETGLDVAPSDLKLVYTLTHDYFGKSVSRLVYGVRVTGRPDITLSYEHEDAAWRPIEQVDDMEKPYQKGIDYANEHHLWDEV